MLLCVEINCSRHAGCRSSVCVFFCDVRWSWRSRCQKNASNLVLVLVYTRIGFLIRLSAERASRMRLLPLPEHGCRDAKPSFLACLCLIALSCSDRHHLIPGTCVPPHREGISHVTSSPSVVPGLIPHCTYVAPLLHVLKRTCSTAARTYSYENVPVVPGILS